MYTILTSTLIALAIGTVLFFTKQFFPAPIAFWGIPILGMLGGFLFIVVGGIFLTGPDDFEKVVNEKELVSLQGNVSTQGNLFLGTGTISGAKKYFYYVETPKGVISRSVYASNTYIEEFDSTGTPRIVTVKYKDHAPKWYVPIKRQTNLEDYTKIYIPEGSITREYDPQ